MPIPRPTLNEQDSIVDVVASITLTIEEARAELTRLRLLKDSTADAILSGRVRVGQIS